MEGSPPARLLGPFDPLLHGWVDRSPVLGPHRGIVTSNGIFQPVALVDGRVVARWGVRAGRITIRPQPVAPAQLVALEQDAMGVLDYLGLPGRPPTIESAP